MPDPMPDPVAQPADVFDAASYHEFMLRHGPGYQTPGSFEQDRRILAEYRARLPVQLLARCPFCARAIVEPVDTFSLNGFGWGQANAGLGWSGSLGLRRREFDYCEHLKIIAFFLNLNGHAPDELSPDKRIASGPEVPSLMLGPLCAPDIKVVMRSLPVGLLDHASPPYTLYFLSYFSADEAAFSAALRAWDVTYPVDYDNVDYDLAARAAQGQLLWLNPDDPELPLVGTDTAEFPYGHIDGDRGAYRTLSRPEPKQRGFWARLLGRD